MNAGEASKGPFVMTAEPAEVKGCAPLLYQTDRARKAWKGEGELWKGGASEETGVWNISMKSSA